MAHSFSFIFGTKSHAGRAARAHHKGTAEAQAAGAGHKGWVVIAFTNTTREYTEMDADDEAHARRLADHAVKDLTFDSASVWQVKNDGALKGTGRGKAIYLASR
jgi:hypothetical protein